jgi:hypothetical protein
MASCSTRMRKVKKKLIAMSAFRIKKKISQRDKSAIILVSALPRADWHYSVS